MYPGDCQNNGESKTRKYEPQHNATEFWLHESAALQPFGVCQKNYDSEGMSSSCHSGTQNAYVPSKH